MWFRGDNFIKLSVKKAFKNFSEFIFTNVNPATFCGIHFKDSLQAPKLCGIYFAGLAPRRKKKKKIGKI